LAKKKAKKKAVKKAAPREKKHPDMLTISMRGDNAKPILAFMKKYHIKGAVLFREAFAVYKEAVDDGSIVPGEYENEED